MDDNALEVMKNMNSNTFTHLPVIDNNKLVGVFSENTIFSYIVKHKDVVIVDDFLIKDFDEFIPIESHESEYFEFMPRETLVIDIEYMFKNGLKNKKRIAVVFITENGNQSEKILGLISHNSLLNKFVEFACNTISMEFNFNINIENAKTIFAL